ncbi:hypothetical protein N894_0793 [Francisella tularensis subsp. novicida PA10-7858]|nr:hypothetical protein N894_0793 [Francisella tularensis subsp. novicida PA10-7858]
MLFIVYFYKAIFTKIFYNFSTGLGATQSAKGFVEFIEAFFAWFFIYVCNII